MNNKLMKKPFFIDRFNDLFLNFEEEIEWQGKIISGIISLIWFITLPFLFIILLDSYHLDEELFLVSFFIGFPILGYFGTKIIYKYISSIRNYFGLQKQRKLLQYIKDLFVLISRKITLIQSIEEILEKVDSIYKLQKILFSIDRKISGTKEYRRKFGGLIDASIEWLLNILTNLRSDLSIRLTEQQQTLESAKSEVEKNIHGTTELNQVSELQRARLDRQIEQFEELQKKLVKV